MDWPKLSLARSRVVRCWLAVASLAIASAPCAAQLMPAGFGAYKHVRWTAENGAPDGINEIVQTPDGYLWLAGETLYRFDGSSFEPIDWPAGSHRRHAIPGGLLVARNGDLWLGLAASGGVAVYRDGVLRDMHMPDPPRTVDFLAQTPDGAIWAASGMFEKRLRRLMAGRWQAADDPLGLPPGAVMGLAADRRGGLWAVLTHQDGASGALAYLAPGAGRFRQIPYSLSARPRLAVDRGGAIWISDLTGTRMLVDGRGTLAAPTIRFASPSNVRAVTATFDRDGGLWGTTDMSGVFHLPNATPKSASTKPSLFGAANGLTSDFAYFPFVDREGSIWIATDGGLDQFSRASATQEAAIPADPINGLAIARANNGDVYIASQGALYRAEPRQTPKPIPTQKLNGATLAICTAHNQGVWLVQPSRTWLIQGDRATASLDYPGKEVPVYCAEDRQGRLWVSSLTGKLSWHDAAGWHPAGGALAKERISKMTATPAGDVAFSAQPDFGVIRGDRLLAIRSKGSPSMLVSGTRDIFFSGANALTRLSGDRLMRLSTERFPWVAQLRALVQTSRGETWMVNRKRISRVATADLNRAFVDPQAAMPYTEFDANDGLTSTMQHGGFTGIQSVVGGDGRVWFLNRQGAAFFDPATLERNKLVPPVEIRALASGGRTWRDPSGLILPPGTHGLDITYAGLSFAVPQRVRFHYRLEGVDDGWVDAGARRTASYTNLAPGWYRFHVIAANNDGVWNPAGATLDFRIRPTFVQSWPFKALCAVALVALLWLAYALRMRAVTNRIRLRMAERLEERERIARELHDTLLQSVQALTLRFQLAADDLPDKAPGRPALIAAIDTADQVIAEGRDRVRDLRSREDGDMEQIVRDLEARLDFDPSVKVSIAIVGVPRPIDPLTLEEVTRIAGEALFNIRRHAQASQVTVEIRYGMNFAMCFTDDGVGIDSALAAGGARDGHFGLSGMRERARKLRGTLVIRRLPERGTEVVLTVPGSIAYSDTDRGLFARLWSLG